MAKLTSKDWQEFMKHYKVNHRIIANWLRGKTRPNIENIVKVSAYFKLKIKDVEDFFGCSRKKKIANIKKQGNKFNNHLRIKRRKIKGLTRADIKKYIDDFLTKGGIIKKLDPKDFDYENISGGIQDGLDDFI